MSRKTTLAVPLVSAAADSPPGGLGHNPLGAYKTGVYTNLFAQAGCGVPEFGHRL